MTTLTIKPSDITASGCAIAFTANGHTIVGKVERKIKGIKVWLDNGNIIHNSVRIFPDKQTAIAYINEIACQEKTAELRWW